jgi:hypothetical protein
VYDMMGRSAHVMYNAVHERLDATISEWGVMYDSAGSYRLDLVLGIGWDWC